MIVTLANLNEATQQQVFDQVVNHLRTQKFQSVDKDGICLYRGENGLKCAAGSLITDSEYRPEMDLIENDSGTSWDNLLERGLVPNGHRKLIRVLQVIHDNRNGEWEIGLEQTAKQFGLHYTPTIKEAL